MSQAVFAQLLGVSTVLVASWEQGLSRAGPLGPPSVGRGEPRSQALACHGAKGLNANLGRRGKVGTCFTFARKTTMAWTVAEDTYAELSRRYAMRITWVAEGIGMLLLSLLCIAAATL